MPAWARKSFRLLFTRPGENNQRGGESKMCLTFQAGLEEFYLKSGNPAPILSMVVKYKCANPKPIVVQYAHKMAHITGTALGVTVCILYYL